MNILGIDVSGKCADVCLEVDGTEVYTEILELGLTHSETLLPLIQNALQVGDYAPSDIDCYAVTVGPGSFTGLRIGLAMVKGLAFAQNTPVAAVSTLHAMAQGSKLCGTVVCALDARRNQVYWAAFSCDGEKAVRITRDSASSAEEVAKAEIFYDSSVFVIGDGAEICYNALGDLQKSVVLSHSAGKHGARGAVELAYEMKSISGWMSADEVEPVYLRLSQAERERMEKISSLETKKTL